MSHDTDGLWCVLPAAGRGTRLGAALPKQYLPLAGRPLIVHTLQRLAAMPQVRGLMLALACDDAHWESQVAPLLDRGTLCRGKPVRVTTGGAERADSVLAALRALPDDVDANHFVLVHDAARPCVRAADVAHLVEQGGQDDGGLLGAPLRDTLKRADADDRSVETEPRDARWRAFTPQMFRRGQLTKALASALDAGVAVTDEAMAMERAGFHPLLVEGAEDNIKVTTPADLALAEFLLPRIDS
ncbi:MAG TPA: 2-C-methyl-D-erythritol 4-phosphate cytidylyltransferase [Rhodanobacteraceae bacterium]|nr:2-C-methyl-D-erythritol 4-phosphate cytidylyltransferase [Rhodanobacteraceae bacterium]